MTPFQVLYGYEPPNWKALVLNDTNAPELRNQVEKSQKTIDLLKDNLIKAQNCMRQQADQHRTEREFEVGDWVFVRLQPYKQVSLKSGGKHKLPQISMDCTRLSRRLVKWHINYSYLVKVVSTMSSMYHVSKKCWVNIK